MIGFVTSRPGSLASLVAPDWRVGEEPWTDEAGAGRVLGCTCGDEGCAGGEREDSGGVPGGENDTTVRQSPSMGCDSFPILVD